jgi:DNA polymerase III alpha subunit
VVTRLRPATRSGAVVVFITLEDEVGLVDCVVFYDTYSKYGPLLMESAGLIVEGKLEQRGHSGLSLIVDTVESLGLDKRAFRTVGGIPPTWAPTLPGFNRRAKPGEGQK